MIIATIRIIKSYCELSKDLLECKREILAKKGERRIDWRTERPSLRSKPMLQITANGGKYSTTCNHFFISFLHWRRIWFKLSLNRRLIGFGVGLQAKGESRLRIDFWFVSLSSQSQPVYGMAGNGLIASFAITTSDKSFRFKCFIAHKNKPIARKVCQKGKTKVFCYSTLIAKCEPLITALLITDRHCAPLSLRWAERTQRFRSLGLFRWEVFISTLKWFMEIVMSWHLLAHILSFL